MASELPGPGSHDLKKLDDLMIRLHANLTMGVKMFLAVGEEVEALKESKASLGKEVEGLTEDKNKLSEIANDNANLAKRFQIKCKTYKQENQDLRRRLAELQNQWSEARADSRSPSAEAAVTGQGHEDLLEEEITEICSSPSDEHPRERRSSKLSRPKSKGKIRYGEIPHGHTTSPPFTLRNPSKDGRVNKNGTAAESQGSTNNVTGNHQLKVDRLQTAAAKSGHHLSDDGTEWQQGSENRERTGNIFVPETEMVRGDTDEDDGNDEDDGERDELEDDERHLKRTDDYRNIIHVPETMPPDSDLFSPIQSDADRTRDGTVQRRNERSYSTNLIPLEQSTPMLDGPLDTASRMLQEAGRSASPLLLKAVRDKKRRSIPPSESQLLVDFSRTQMSPTFDGAEGRSTPDRPSSGKQRYSGATTRSTFKAEHNDAESNEADYFGQSREKLPSSSQEQSKQEKKHIIWAISSRSGPSASAPETPNISVESAKTSALPTCDESGQSEASFLILQQPSQPKPKAQLKASTGEISGHSQERRLNRDLESRPKRSRSSDEAVDEEGNLTKRKKAVSSDIEEQEDSIGEVGEHLLSDQDMRNGRHHEERGHSKSERLKSETFGGSSSSSDARPHLSNTEKKTYKMSKQLVQTKLTKDSFKPVRSPLGQRQREINGGGRVDVDSQDDPYIKKALQESIQMVGLQDYHSRDQTSGDFKVPMIPKSHNQTTKGREDEHDIGSDMYEGNLNGSIDPAIDLSLLGDNSENEFIYDKENKGLKDSRGVGSGRRGESAVNLSDSCEHRVKTYGLSFEGGDGDAEPILVDDSFADMFEDDDKERSLDMEQDHAIEEKIEDKKCFYKSSELMEDEIDDDARYGLHHRIKQEQTSFVRHFDSLPKKEEPPTYKFKQVVRKRDDRQKLKGFDCKECAGYYGGLGLTDEEIALRTKNCSRHRGHYSPPSTPEHYWSIDFPDTPTCIQRGYMKEAAAVEQEQPPRRRRRYKHNFTKTKEEGQS